MYSPVSISTNSVEPKYTSNTTRISGKPRNKAMSTAIGFPTKRFASSTAKIRLKNNPRINEQTASPKVIRAAVNIKERKSELIDYFVIHLS